MRLVPDESVHLVITSPPYWQLKDYGPPDQIGYHESYESYINHLNLVWQECWRVLHPGCRLCINIGDQFARAAYYGRYKIIPIRTEIIKFCETIGFDYLGAIIWQKVTTCHTSGGATIMGSFPYPRNGLLKLDYEFILIFKKLGVPPPVPKDLKERSRLTTEEWNTYFYGHWNFPGEKQRQHLAMFPEELPRRLIKMFSFVGETVLDPFLGSGTTSLAAKNLDRHSIGYEINEDFLPLIKEKLGLQQASLLSTSDYQIICQEQSDIDYQARIARLPYIFRDPIRFDKKSDPKRQTFGSRIDLQTPRPRDYHRVKEVMSPTLVRLDNGQQVRLLGVKEKPEQSEKAIEYLREIIQGNRVYLSFDKFLNYDPAKNLYAYLYLANKTFVNAQLIKQGLVEVDPEVNHKYRSRFQGYRTSC
ncbi:MAG: site-specific DNA-methyltransferase [Deltaproteobacteria bacterium]|nr:site-specific DNA-methyltransferase [Deltaproteobacteria bacterium]MBW1987627.1 site-specific DNA-methyltransferase [Deltaproteobacteria bacterium]